MYGFWPQNFRKYSTNKSELAQPKVKWNHFSPQIVIFKKSLFLVLPRKSDF